MSSLPTSIKRIWSKATEKRWRHHFPHYKSMGAICCHGHQSFDPICLKTLCSLSPLPVMLYIKFDQDWPPCLRDIQVRKCKIFVIQGQVTPKWVVWSGPKSNSSELLYLSWLPATLMMIKNEWASMETAFSHYKSMGNFLDASLPASIKKIWSKTTDKRWRHCFSHIKSMGAFCCHGNQFWSNLPQNLMQPFPHSSDATHKIWSRLASWLQRYTGLKVWTTTTDDGRRRTIATL